jgi:hypothetical protein
VVGLRQVDGMVRVVAEFSSMGSAYGGADVARFVV